MDWNKLKEPFPECDLEWRLQSCGEKNGKFWGKALAYITSRAVQDRLDEVCGPDNWQVSVRKEGDAYLSTLSIRVKHDDGTVEWLSRTDGADATDVEPVKGGISGAIKRSAVLFGIGRYLYNLKDSWAVIDEHGKYVGTTKEKKTFRWNPPKLTAEFLPKGTKVQPESKPASREESTPREEPKEEPSEELIKQTTILENYINDGVLSGNFLKRAKEHIENGNLKGINDTIAWIEANK